MKQTSAPLNIKVDLTTLGEKLGGYSFENKIMMVNYTSANQLSSPDAWEQDLTMRLDIVCCILVTDGTLSLSINYKHIEIRKNTLLFISTFDIIENPRLSDDGKYFVLMFKRNFMEEVTTNIYFQIDPSKIIPRTETLPFLKLTDSELIALEYRFNSLYYYLKEKRGEFQKFFILSTFYTLGLEFLYIITGRNAEITAGAGENNAGRATGEINLQKTNASPSSGESRKNSILRSFLILLNENCITEHNPSFYAQKLFISVQYLSLILKEKTGQTAGDWIANVLVLRAKALLRAPDASIASVAEQLCFADQSSFGKFFKKHTGQTPKSYINSQH